MLTELDDVTVRYNAQNALEGVSLAIGEGERIALVGQSGAGKSTLLSVLHDRLKREAALLPQDLGLVRTLSVFHNVYMARLDRHRTWYNLVNLAWPLRDEVRAVREVVARLGLEDKLFAPAGELSGGQQQRAALARAIHRGCPVFLGDEPVSAIDPKQSRAVLDYINERHATVVLALHDVALALDYADRIVGIRQGRIVLDAPARGMKPADLDDVYR